MIQSSSYLWNEERLGRVEVSRHVMHHGEDGVVQFFRILVKVFENDSVLTHHLNRGKSDQIDSNFMFNSLSCYLDKRFFVRIDGYPH